MGLAEHRSKYDHLHTEIDPAWLEIGWKLLKLNEWRQIPKVFRSVGRSDEYTLRLLATELAEPVIAEVEEWIGNCGTREAAKRLHSMREAVSGLRGEIIPITEELNLLSQETIQLAKRLLKDLTPETRNFLSQHQEQLTESIRHLGELKSSLQNEYQFGETVLKNCEAYFCQREFFAFCQRGKYRLTPCNVAAAVASLPYTGCTQSAQICSKWRLPGDGPTYELLKVITRMQNHWEQMLDSPMTTDAILDVVANWIRQRSPNESHATAELKRNNKRLKQAVRRVLNRKLVRTARPFAIARTYKRLLRSKSDDEALSERIEKILEQRRVIPVRNSIK